MTQKKWRQNRNYAHVHFRIQPDTKPFEYAACGRENFRIRKKIFAEKKISGYVWTCCRTCCLVVLLSCYLLSDITDLYGLQQLINEPIRVTDTTSTLGGLIYTNYDNKVICSGVFHVRMSDHSLISDYRSGCAQKDPYGLLQRSPYIISETSWSWKQYVQRTHRIGVNLNDSATNLTVTSGS